MQDRPSYFDFIQGDKIKKKISKRGRSRYVGEKNLHIKCRCTSIYVTGHFQLAFDFSLRGLEKLTEDRLLIQEAYYPMLDVVIRLYRGTKKK